MTRDSITLAKHTQHARKLRRNEIRQQWTTQTLSLVTWVSFDLCSLSGVVSSDVANPLEPQSVANFDNSSLQTVTTELKVYSPAKSYTNKPLKPSGLDWWVTLAFSHQTRRYTHQNSVALHISSIIPSFFFELPHVRAVFVIAELAAWKPPQNGVSAGISELPCAFNASFLMSLCIDNWVSICGNRNFAHQTCNH